MSNLRVTDVQALLRSHASAGHDVISDGRTATINGQRYGMAVGHDLFLPVTRDSNKSSRFDGMASNSILNSYIQQSERPLISQVISSMDDNPKDSPGFHSMKRYAFPLAPQMSSAGGSDTMVHNYRAQNHVGTGTHLDTSKAPEGSTLWTPDKENDHADIHEALAAHRTPDVSHTGLYFEGYSDARPMTSSEMGSFDHKGAMARLLDKTPTFKGLVNINHQHAGGTSFYTYNPETEQLHKYEDG